MFTYKWAYEFDKIVTVLLIRQYNNVFQYFFQYKCTYRTQSIDEFVYIQFNLLYNGSWCNFIPGTYDFIHYFFKPPQFNLKN